MAHRTWRPDSAKLAPFSLAVLTSKSFVLKYFFEKFFKYFGSGVYYKRWCVTIFLVSLESIHSFALGFTQAVFNHFQISKCLFHQIDHVIQASLLVLKRGFGKSLADRSTFRWSWISFRVPWSSCPPCVETGLMSPSYCIRIEERSSFMRPRTIFNFSKI